MKNYKYYTKNDFLDSELIEILEELEDIRLKREEILLFKLILLCLICNSMYFFYF